MFQGRISIARVGVASLAILAARVHVDGFASQALAMGRMRVRPCDLSVRCIVQTGRGVARGMLLATIILARKTVQISAFAGFHIRRVSPIRWANV